MLLARFDRGGAEVDDSGDINVYAMDTAIIRARKIRKLVFWPTLDAAIWVALGEVEGRRLVFSVGGMGILVWRGRAQG